MFFSLGYFIVLFAVCSCQTYYPTDPTKPANISGIFYRYFPEDLKSYVDVPLQKGVNLLKASSFDKAARTIFYIQTWQENANSPAPQAIVGAYLKNFHTNQVVFDWSNINTALNYGSVAKEVQKVGKAFGRHLCKLFAAGLNPNETELIAFSLGAHVAGKAGDTTKKLCKHPIKRIVTLDASARLFDWAAPLYRRINKNDATQTIAIHTSGDQHGIFLPIAKADFYVNEGAPIQPSCGAETLANLYCNANRSWQVYAASIEQPKLFRAARADDYNEFSDQTCEENAKKEAIFMGPHVDQELQGIFYFSTDGEYPYGRGDEGLCV